MWAYPQEKSAKQQMRLCYEDLNKDSTVQDSSGQYATALHERFSAEKMYKKMIDAIYAPTKEELEWEKELSSVELV
tara:strand:- start:537 stop:764 length:228 start_codon:yes stop_codon:yes gene_type:complete